MSPSLYLQNQKDVVFGIHSFPMLQTANPDSQAEVSKNSNFLLHIPHFTGEAIYPACQQAHSRPGPRSCPAPPSTPGSWAWSTQGELHAVAALQNSPCGVVHGAISLACLATTLSTTIALEGTCCDAATYR